MIGNVGDSRAILGTRDENDCLTAVQLTVDLKPNLPGHSLFILVFDSASLVLKKDLSIHVYGVGILHI